jgi:triacylglycerol lipase
VIPRTAILALALVGCAPSHSARCDELKTELEKCLGTRFSRLDCETITDADINRAHDFTRGISCALLAQSLPADGDPLALTCRLANVGCVEAITPAPTPTPTRYPILLVNGIDTSPLFRYSKRILEMMAGQGGQTVFLATLPPYEAPRRRAPELWSRINGVRAQTGAEKVNLICHSLGGFDCRYLVSPHGLGVDLANPFIAESVASITTIGTAHRGTRLADAMLGLLPDADRGRTVNDFATLVGDWFSDQTLTQDVHLREALQALTLSGAQTFNAEINDAPGVYYQSWAGYSRPFGEASHEHDLTLATLCQTASGEGLPGFGKHDFMALTLVPFTELVGKSSGQFIPNDGLAAVDSAKWGNFRGCIPADHQEQLGQHNLPDVNVQTGFDVARFYANVAADLATRGF